MAARDWICFSIEYRLSPRATFPDHVIDVKRAVAWVRENAAEWGVDPSFIVIAGGSAGAHLASLAALRPNHAAWQPGFEEADTTRAGLHFLHYGVYDFTNRFGHWPARGLRMLLERWVLKARLDEARPRFADASPLEHVGPGAPPFLVAHGSRDSIVPVDEARQFVAVLRERGKQPCVYLEVPGAQHAFEVFPSLRTVALARRRGALCRLSAATVSSGERQLRVVFLAVKPTVLVIDDEKTFRIVAEEALAAEGFEVTSASSGEAGLARLAEGAERSGHPRPQPARYG